MIEMQHVPPISPPQPSDSDTHEGDHTSISVATTTSPEAAGIVRGASRTVLQSLAKRKAGVVRNASSRSKGIMSEISTAKILKTPKNVAQVSDRMAMGVDLVTVAMEQQEHEMNGSNNQMKSSADVKDKGSCNHFDSVGKWKGYRESAMNITYSTCIDRSLHPNHTVSLLLYIFIVITMQTY
jgi:hypothetical protein